MTIERTMQEATMMAIMTGHLCTVSRPKTSALARRYSLAVCLAHATVPAREGSLDAIDRICDRAGLSGQ